VASASDGTLYVTAQGNLSGYGNNVQTFDILGQFTSSFGTFGILEGAFQHPFGIDIDSLGNIYVVDSGNHRVQKFDSAGNFLSTWGSAGSGIGQFLRPTGIAVDHRDRVYVADLLNHRIQVFDTAGVFDFEIGGPGFADGQFLYPIDIAAGDTGDVYVVDFGNSRIQRFGVANEITIDLRPGGSNSINLNSNGLVIVGLLTTSIADGDSEDFDATDVDVSTLMLGGAAAEHSNGHIVDIDGDGDLDLFIHFRIPDIGLSCGDTTVQLSGMTSGGEFFLGEDLVTTTHCS
jgi:sugar lactone lactonase YvrE